MSRINLTTAEPLAPQTATWIEWRELNINISEKTVTVKYVWHNDTGVVPVDGKVEQTYLIQNHADNPDTPENEANPEFDEVFGFTIRAQDAGKKVGRALQTLIWAKMKASILAEGNDGTFVD